MTDQRLTLSVPSFTTSMNVGAAWQGTEWNSAGFCVNTTARVWLDSEREYGEGSSTSTLSLLANGSGAGVGQLLLQSLESNVYMFGQDTTVMAAGESLFMAGAKGVKLLAGHDAPGKVLFTRAGRSIDRIAPDDDDPSANHAKDYTDWVEHIADCWAVADGLMGAASLFWEGLRQAAGVRGAGSSAVTAATVLGLATAAKTTSGAVNVSRRWVDEVPGLHLFSFSSVNLQTTGFATVYAGTSLTMSGLLSYGEGYIDAAAVAGVAASIKSASYAWLSGSVVDVVAGKDISIGSLGILSGSLEVNAKELVFGAEMPAASVSPAQLSTDTVKMEALSSIAWSSLLGNIALEAPGEVVLTGNTVAVSASKEVVIEGPTYTVRVGIDGIAIDVVPGMHVGVDASAARADAKGVMGLEVSAEGVSLGSAGAFLEVDVTGVWTWQGPLFSLV